MVTQPLSVIGEPQLRKGGNPKQRCCLPQYVERMTAALTGGVLPITRKLFHRGGIPDLKYPPYVLHYALPLLEAQQRWVAWNMFALLVALNAWLEVYAPN